MEKHKKKLSSDMLDFLMTYGWAILVVLSAIGALAYFGVLPDLKVCSCQNECTLTAGEGFNQIDCCVTESNFTGLGCHPYYNQSVIIWMNGSVDVYSTAELPG